MGKRDHNGTWDIHELVCASEPGGCHVRAALLTFCLCQTMRKRELGCWCLFSMSLVVESVTEGKALPVAVCVTSCVDALCMLCSRMHF